MRQFDPSTLRAHREAAGLSRERVAVIIDRSYSAVVQYESGALTPPTAVLARLSALLDVSVDEFFTDQRPAGAASGGGAQ